eukprot:TRINITY_DN1608_c0_g1_i1.p1 TRINITY_DN1608_c0_g1~~TRINITY_DN1608_c0_g1_i1.p1  ORF type:complete len:959 (+),score=298.99 TRINITY_DN1608_c0_g1_i1:83-2959(+)
MALARDVLQRVRPLLGIPEKEDFIGQAVEHTGEPVPCECARRGTARLWLFRKHIGLEFDEGHPAQCIAVDSICRLTRSRRAFMQKNSFAYPPVCHVVINIHTDPPHDDTIVLVFTERSAGERVGRAAEFLWRHSNDELSEREARHLSCNRFADVVTIAALLPIEEQCQFLERTGSRPREGSLCITAEGAVTFTESTAEGQRWTWDLDKVLMLRKVRVSGMKSYQLVLQVQAQLQGSIEEPRFAKFGGVGIDEFEAKASKAWCLAMNSDVNFRIANEHVPEGFCASPYRKRRESVAFEKVREYEEKVCFPLRDVLSLLQTFQTIDSDKSGMLSRGEWIDSLGPLFRRSKVPDIVFGVFDHNCDGQISFPEFLFGCRILHLGSPEDRLVYQFRIFDPHGKGSITLEQFTNVVGSLDTISNVRRPAGEPIEAWCQRMYAEMDVNDDGTVDINDFRHTVMHNEDFTSTFTYLAQKRKAEQKKAKVNGRLVWFGDPQWLMSTAILQGCKLALERRKQILQQRGQAPRMSSYFPQAFHEVCTWELGTGRMLQEGERPQKKPLMTSDGHPTRKDAPDLVRWESYFSDHCPQVFLTLQTTFGADPDQYLQSLGLDQLESSMLVGSLSSLCTMSSSGRSGAFFFASHDGRYILKTIPAAEGGVLKQILPAYYDHMINNPDTLLTRYFGLHTLHYGGKTVTFLVMDNVMQPEKEVHIIYDLKGSKIGRTTRVDQRKPGNALKDLDFRRTIDVPRDLRTKFMDQMRKDSEMLMNQNLNDYSFLVGIHTSPTPLPPPPELETSASMSERRPVFRQTYGGFPSRDGREVFYAGIIDILTYYGLKKKGEHGLKSMRYKSYEVSCVPPEIYRERFVRYIESIFDVSAHSTGAGGAWLGAKKGHHSDRHHGDHGQGHGRSRSFSRKLSSQLGRKSSKHLPSHAIAVAGASPATPGNSPRYIDPSTGYRVTRSPA